MLRRFVSLCLGLMVSSVGFAQTSATSSASPHQGSMQSMLLMVVVFIAIFYFLLIRPQSKRSKEQKQLMEGLSIGDEITTSGGIVGRITKLKDGYVVISVGKDSEITFQKSSISNILPKGTIESVNG